MMKNELSKGIDIELGEEMAEGQYANMVVIAHSTSEFVLDFVRIMPGLPKARVKSRIVLAPEHAKRLLLLAARKHRPLRKLDRSDPDPQLVFRRNKTSHEFSRRRGLTRAFVSGILETNGSNPPKTPSYESKESHVPAAGGCQTSPGRSFVRCRNTATHQWNGKHIGKAARKIRPSHGL